MNQRSLGGIGRAFSNPNFRVYTAGSAVSLIGTWLQKTAVGWTAWELTHDPAWVGIVVSADLVTTVLSSPYAGVIADRQSNLRLLMILQSLCLLQALSLAILSFLGLMTVELLVILTLLLGVIMGFNQPIRQSLINQLVRKEDVAPAVAMTSVIYNVARVIGPSIAGFVIHFAGAGAAFALNALSFVAMIVALRYVTITPAVLAVRGRVLQDIAAGYRYALKHRGIMPMLLISLVSALLLRPVIEMLPAYVGQVFKGGADDLGLLMTAHGAGATLFGLVQAWRGASQGLVRLTAATLLLGPLTMVAFGATDNLWFAAVSIFAMGAVMTMRGTSTQTLIQNNVDPAMRGRVLALYSMIFNVGPAAGSLLLGLVATWAGLRMPLYVAAALSLLLWIWTLRRQPELVRVLEEEPAAAAQAAIDEAKAGGAAHKAAE